MDHKLAVIADQISKEYKLYKKPTDRLKEAITRKKLHDSFNALNGVSFSVSKNECIGIVGKNGSGKSTLLKIITGVLTPTSGHILINGKISALLELGAGFNPDLTGLENIYLNGTIMGFSHKEMESRLEEILEFADIGDFIHQPVKTYSSGMFVRLAFSVAINVEPDILIVDEALSVGDLRFQQKCYRKIDELKKSKTIIVVSHDMSVINKYCDRVIWINEGRLVGEGTPKEISKRYQAFMIGANFKSYDYNESLSKENDMNYGNDIDELSTELDIMGDDSALITGMSIIDVLFNRKVSIVEAGDKIRVLIRLNVFQSINSPIIGFTIKDRLGTIITQTNSFVLGEQLDTIQIGSGYVFGFEFDFPSLNHGQYTISPAIASGSQEDHKQHSWVHDALIVEVLPKSYETLSGVICLEGVTFSALDRK
ncbi:ABC transporter ATP-binding protein [Paenibacillus sp. GYB006]|uniref:ABC transporter ATP-binding protein n=1 Tax=Paenibacillus sp. GYB006 TaxID=2994394 RepID=UPI002F96B4C6